MAATAVLPAMSADGRKNVHPFFSKKANGLHPSRDERVHSETAATEPEEQSSKEEQHTSDSKLDRMSGPQKQKNDQTQRTRTVQRTLSQIANTQAAAPIKIGFVDPGPSEPILDGQRRKRRRTNDHEAIDVGSEDKQLSEAQPRAPNTPRSSRQCSPHALQRGSAPFNESLPVAEISDSMDSRLTAHTTPLSKTPPKKVLRLKSNGKFNSPPTKKAKEVVESAPEVSKRRGRTRRHAGVGTERCFLVKFGYGTDESSRSAIGTRISQILDGKEKVQLDDVQSTPSTPRNDPHTKTKSKIRTPQDPSKPVHPLFNRRKEQLGPKPAKLESPRKATAATPGKIRMQAMADRMHDGADTQTFTSALLRDRLMIRHPGAKEAPFPALEQTHVRGDSRTHIKQSLTDSSFDLLFGRRKRKNARLPIPPQESILYQFSLGLHVEKDRVLRPDGYYEPNKRLHVPKRLLLSGDDIAQRVASQLSVSLSDSSADELSHSYSDQQIHTALQRLYNRIPNILTAFDESRGEVMPWTQKYAPSTHMDLLQPENEVKVLKDWLSSLAVQAVIGTTPIPRAKALKQIEKPKQKRKKKAGEMDDFLVDSDEDIRDMNEINESTEASPPGPRKTARSVVQVLDGNTRLSNAVLLSGPHGCGKTAAAYAIAKELGFKVFEISSSERRSGRDVLDKVGDMTENHLVKHHGTDSVDSSEAEEPTRIDEAFQKDLQSGRQGKMGSFFKPKMNLEAKPKKPQPKHGVREKTLKAVQEALTKPPRDQQQSLILLEEVDILFKDDKDFWVTILKLITTSKRPFIMTCNDEDLVPLQAISLHAILRLKQPAPELAVDYMLLIAAAEGHLLRRPAVQSLYLHHGSDLRASITELDYWCQMAVGDPKEGLSWLFQRWPPDTDLDGHGRRLRVVSDDTYRQGMGITPAYDPIPADALWWSWNELGLDPNTALGWRAMDGHLTSNSTATLTGTKQNLRALADVASLTDVLSAADFCTSSGLPGSACLDPSQPEFSDKARTNFIEGMALLQTDERVEHSDMSRQLMIALSLAAHVIYDHDAQAQTTKTILDGVMANKLATRCEGRGLTRQAFACFDPISVPAEVSFNVSLQQSAFDSPIGVVALDLAPYVRAITHFDQALEEQRERLGLLTADGRKAKRARTTRAARSALEGGFRATTRKERWFTQDLDMEAVLATGGKDWPKFTAEVPSMAGSGTESIDAPASSAETG